MLQGSFVCAKPKNNSYLYLLILLENNTPCFKGFGITQLITSSHGEKYATKCMKGASGMWLQEQTEISVLNGHICDGVGSHNSCLSPEHTALLIELVDSSVMI
jgi:hypothetical protein